MGSLEARRVAEGDRTSFWQAVIVDLFFGGSAWWDSSCPAASLQVGRAPNLRLIILRESDCRIRADDPSEARRSLHQPDRRRDQPVRAHWRRQMAAANRTRGRRNFDPVFLSGLVPAFRIGNFDRAQAGAAHDRRQAGAAAIVAAVLIFEQEGFRLPGP